MDYSSKNHARFLLLSHLIFVCKYRKRLLIRYGDETKKIVEGIAAKSDVSCETMEVDQDHIHCLVKSEARMRTTCHCTEVKTRIDHSALADT